MAYSLDLRERVIDRLKPGHSVLENVPPCLFKSTGMEPLFLLSSMELFYWT